MCFCFDLLFEPGNRQVRNMMRLDVLDDSTIRASDDERLAELTAQESIQVTRENLVRIGDDAQYMLTASHSIHIGTSVYHPANRTRASDESPIFANRELRVLCNDPFRD
jgi:hypothetical protein